MCVEINILGDAKGVVDSLLAYKNQLLQRNQVKENCFHVYFKAELRSGQEEAASAQVHLLELADSQSIIADGSDYLHVNKVLALLMNPSQSQTREKLFTPLSRIASDVMAFEKQQVDFCLFLVGDLESYATNVKLIDVKPGLPGAWVFEGDRLQSQETRPAQRPETGKSHKKPDLSV